MSLICKNIRYSYEMPGSQVRPIIKDISLNIEQGESVGIMGRTGSGKTTLIEILAGLIKPQSGQVLFDGIDAYSSSYGKHPVICNRGIVFQKPEQQFFETTVEREVAFALRGQGLSKSQISQRVHEALDFVGLNCDEIGACSPFVLSGGQQRRVAIASVMVARTSLLILDEPTAGLDPQGIQLGINLIRAAKLRGSVIVVSHDVNVVAETCDRIIVLDKGRVVLDGFTRDVVTDNVLMQQWGLVACAPAHIAQELIKAGLSLPRNVLTYQELEQATKATLRRTSISIA